MSTPDAGHWPEPIAGHVGEWALSNPGLRGFTWLTLAIWNPHDDAPRRVVVLPIEPKQELIDAFSAVWGHWAIPLTLSNASDAQAVRLERGADYGSAFGIRIDRDEVLLGGYAVQVEATLTNDDEARPTSAGPAGWMQDLAGYALDLGDIVAKAGVSALVGAEAKALWDRYKQTRRKPFTAVDAENAARTLIRLEYPSAELLTDPSVRRTDTDNGWVVRLTSHASSRVFSVRIDDKRGLGQIEYESL